MTCASTLALLHALLDGELDAEHARKVQLHLSSCASCRAQRRAYRRIQEVMSGPGMIYRAPESLRGRLDALLTPTVAAPTTRASKLGRRGMLRGLAMGSLASTALAACLVLFVVNGEVNQRIAGDAVSAHLRSLQGHHLIDVQSTDQHTVKPWFNGRLELAPPVVDLKSQGFTLVGGRIDYLDGHPAAAVVYQRGDHIINLFVTQRIGSERQTPVEALRGFNVWRWAWADLSFWAVSDLSAPELEEFGKQLEDAIQGADVDLLGGRDGHSRTSAQGRQSPAPGSG
jgi:anti-sigma factor RsiW